MDATRLSSTVDPHVAVDHHGGAPAGGAVVDLTASPPTLTPRVSGVRVVGADPLVNAGVIAFLAQQSAAGPPDRGPGCDVVVAVVEAVDERAAVLVRAQPPGAHESLLLLAGRLDAPGVAAAVRLGALGVLRRAGLSPVVLGAAVCAVARREAVVPPDLLGELFGQTRQDRRSLAAPPTLSVVRLSERERAVLRFLADGADTREIARSLRYSERTVKTVIQDMTRRFGLRNRTHAVAYAMRNGLV